MNVKHQEKQQEHLNVTLKPFSFHNIEELKSSWLTLEQHADVNFFLSWQWIGCWLQQLKNAYQPIILEVKQNNNIVGLGIFVEKKIYRHNIVHSTQWYLHRTGDEQQDQIWIENNYFLIKRQNKEAINKAIWAKLYQQPQVDEFIIAIYKHPSMKNVIPAHPNFTENVLYQDIGYHINLNKFSTINEYLQILSKNTRNQLKRSIKNLEKHGQLEFIVESLPELQWQILTQCKTWHIQKWQNTSTPSGFTNKLFTQFHQQLIFAPNNKNTTVVARLSQNNIIKGCLYCFVDNENAYFYLSCLEPNHDNKIKLGLTLHYFFIDWLLSNKLNHNIHKYDFLAGDARYKKSLSNHQDNYCFLVIQKKSFKFLLEKQLQKAYQFLKSLFIK